MSELHEAIYRGPFTAELATGHTVAFGDRALVTLADLESAHWEAVKTDAPVETPTPPAPSPAPASPPVEPPAPSVPATDKPQETS